MPATAGPRMHPSIAQALAGVTPTVIESRSKDWVPLLLGFCAAKGGVGGGEAIAGRRDVDSDDEDGADAEDAALAGETPCNRKVVSRLSYATRAARSILL